jgi:hypothetical protein
MSQNAVLTQGTILQRGDGATPTEVFTAVPDVVSITGPDATKAEIDVTDLASTAKEFKGGLADFGRMVVELNYIPGNTIHDVIRDDFNSPASPVRNWRLIFVNGFRWNFSGYVGAFPGNTQPDSVQKSAMTIRLSGPVVEVVNP